MGEVDIYAEIRHARACMGPESEQQREERLKARRMREARAWAERLIQEERDNTELVGDITGYKEDWGSLYKMAMVSKQIGALADRAFDHDPVWDNKTNSTGNLREEIARSIVHLQLWLESLYPGESEQ